MDAEYDAGNSFVQDCGISIADGLEIPQPYAKPLIY